MTAGKTPFHNHASVRWILDSFSKDLVFIFLPGFVGILVSCLLPTTPFHLMIYVFVASTFVNAGHVYTTAWRTVFRKEERESHPLYWAAPLTVTLLVFSWLYFKIPYLWSFVVYVTAYHQGAQFYGFLKWYEKLNRRPSAVSGYFLWTLLIVPFVVFHFRQVETMIFYTDHDILFYPNAGYLRTGLWVYAAVVAAWLAHEVILVFQKQFEFNRFLAMLGPAVIYAYCFLIGTNGSQILFPLFLSHGIPYVAVTAMTLGRLNRPAFGTVYKTGLLLAVTALAGGVATRLYGAYVIPIDNSYVRQRPSVLTAVLTGIYLVPLLCHYIFDGHIWKSKHRDSRLIYSTRPEAALSPTGDIG